MNSSIPVDAMANDPTARAVADGLGLDQQAVESVVGKVQSIRVSAIKPLK